MEHGVVSTAWTRQLSSELTLSAGSVLSPTPITVNTPVFEGLQVIVSLNGKLSGSVDGRAPFAITDAGVYLVLARGSHEGCDRFAANTLQRYVKVGLDAGHAQRSGFDLERLAVTGGQQLHRDGVLVMRQALTPALRAIATQILMCPFDGAVRDMYMAGKALEMAAVASDRVLGRSRGGASGADLSAFEIERLQQARELAEQHFQQPLGLPEIARLSGLNVKKLTAGFRQLFGVSVFEYVQDYRLQEAYRMLSAGGYTVTQVACFVGYAIPHFSTLFRQRFGMPPSQLARA